MPKKSGKAKARKPKPKPQAKAKAKTKAKVRKKPVTRTKRVTAAKTKPKKPVRRSGGPKASKKQAEQAARIIEETRRRKEQVLDHGKTAEERMPVYYAYTFVTSWQGHLPQWEQERVAQWERERLLYSVIRMSDRFTIHETDRKRLIVKRDSASGFYHTIIEVYVEFSDNENEVPVAELDRYRDPMHLLDELELDLDLDV